MSSSDPKYEYYLSDLGFLLKEYALESKKRRDSERKGSDDYLFQAGRNMAYFEVISLIQNQAENFGIDLEKLNLRGINPMKDLL